MIRMLTWLALLAAVAIYALITTFFPFDGPVALAIHFVRIAVTVAATIVYIHMLPTLFEEVPTPRRDYLLAGIIFMLLSAICFSFWNEAGRIWKVDTSVFTSLVAGLFSLFLIVGAGFVLIAPDKTVTRTRTLSLIIGAIVSVGLVFIAPMFR